MIRMSVATEGELKSQAKGSWVAVQSTSLLNLLPASRFYTGGAIATDFAFISVNLTGSLCILRPSVEDVDFAMWTALYGPLQGLGYTLCRSEDLVAYQCCSHYTEENGNATCLGFTRMTVALFPLTLQVLIAGGLGCYLFYYVAGALQRWHFYGVIQQNAEIVSCPAFHLLLHGIIRKHPALYKHVVYWLQLLLFGTTTAVAAIFVTMQPTDWPPNNDAPLAEEGYQDRVKFYAAILLSPVALLAGLLFLRFDLGPVRPSPQSANIFLFACRRKRAGTTWWQFFSFVKLVNIDAILNRVVTRWVMTAMLLVLLSFGILLFYDSTDFSQLIGITLTTIMPLIPRLAQTATPVVIEFERGYLRERVTEIFAALATERDLSEEEPLPAATLPIPTSSLPSSLPSLPSDSDDSDDSPNNGATADLETAASDAPFLIDEPSAFVSIDGDRLLVDTVSDTAEDFAALALTSKRKPSVVHRSYSPGKDWWLKSPTNAIIGASEASHKFVSRELKQLRNLLTLNVVHQSLCLATATAIGIALYFILWGFDDRTLNITSNLKFVFWAVLLAFSALGFLREMVPVSFRASVPGTMTRWEWLASACLILGILTIAILAADAMTIFAWSMISYAVVYPSPGLPALGFFLAILSSFLILSNELSDPFLTVRILVRDAGRLLPPAI